MIAIQGAYRDRSVTDISNNTRTQMLSESTTLSSAVSFSPGSPAIRVARPSLPLSGTLTASFHHLLSISADEESDDVYAIFLRAETVSFCVEHLASVPILTKETQQPTILDGLNVVKGRGGFWTKIVVLTVTPDGVELHDPESNVSSTEPRGQHVAVYPIERIAQMDCVIDDEDFGDMFCFVTYHKVQHVIHVFQCGTFNITPKHVQTTLNPQKQARLMTRALFHRAQSHANALIQLNGEKKALKTLLAERGPTAGGGFLPTAMQPKKFMQPVFGDHRYNPVPVTPQPVRDASKTSYTQSDWLKKSPTDLLSNAPIGRRRVSNSSEHSDTPDSPIKATSFISDPATTTKMDDNVKVGF